MDFFQSDPYPGLDMSLLDISKIDTFQSYGVADGDSPNTVGFRPLQQASSFDEVNIHTIPRRDSTDGGPSLSLATGSQRAAVSNPSTLVMTLAKSGPISSPVTIPPRAKPGRKPVKENNDGDRRREQNRVAQRKFRDVRAQKIEELQMQLSDVNYQMEAEQRAHYEDKASSQRQVKELEQQLQAAHARIDYLLDAARSQIPAQPKDVLTPCSDGGATSPVDKSQQPHTFPTPVDFTTYGKPLPSDFSCGFCTDASNCQCQMDEPPAASTARPGTCAACLSDPARAAACRQLASTATSNSTEPITDSSLALAPMMSCVDFMTKATNVAPLASIKELFGTRVHARPSSSGGYELDEHEAAEGIALLAAGKRRKR